MHNLIKSILFKSRKQIQVGKKVTFTTLLQKKKNLLKTYPAQNKAIQVYKKKKLKLSSGIK